MSFVFASHASVDKPKIKPIVDALLQRGFSLWIDDPISLGLAGPLIQPALRIRTGSAWDTQIDAALRASGCVLVFLSTAMNSLDSRFVWFQEIAYAKTTGKLVACRIDALEVKGLPSVLAAQQILNLCSDQPSESWRENLKLLVLDVERALAKTALNTSTDRDPEIARSLDPSLPQAERRWLQATYEREVHSMLMLDVQIFDREGKARAIRQAFSDPSFKRVIPEEIRLDSKHHPIAMGSVRASPASYRRAKGKLVDRRMTIAVSPAHAGALSLFKYLSDIENLDIEVDFSYAHSVEILEGALRGELAYDGFTLTTATTGVFLREKGGNFAPFCLMPSMTHGVLASASTARATLDGEYLLMRDTPSSELMIVQGLMDEPESVRFSVSEAEPDEATRALGSGSSTVRAIIGFPHYAFNMRYNNCILLPGPAGQIHPSKNVFLFMSEGFASDMDRAVSFEVALRHSWLMLLENPKARSHVVSKILDDPRYIETLFRITGVKTLVRDRSATPSLATTPLNLRTAPRAQAPSIARCRAHEVIQLRQRVLRRDGRREEVVFPEDAWDQSLHYCARDSSGRIIGCVSLLPSQWRDNEAWQLRAMAIDEAYQKRGLGRRMIVRVDSDLDVDGLRRPIVWCIARMTAVGFYAKLGWRAMSPVIENGGAGPSVIMIREYV